MHLARRFLCAEKANRRVKNASPSAVVRLFASVETNQALTWGLGPTSHPPWVLVPGYREAEPPLAPVPRLLEAVAEDQCSISRHPAHGPTKLLSAEVTGQSAAGTGVAVGVTKGGPAVIAPTGAQKQRANRQSNFGPTCRLVSSPEAGSGATIGTLNQGYPLLQYEDTVPMRRSLAVR
jgi:hypothetical protein